MGTFPLKFIKSSERGWGCPVRSPKDARSSREGGASEGVGSSSEYDVACLASSKWCYCNPLVAQTIPKEWIAIRGRPMFFEIVFFYNNDYIYIYIYIHIYIYIYIIVYINILLLLLLLCIYIYIHDISHPSETIPCACSGDTRPISVLRFWISSAH